MKNLIANYKNHIQQTQLKDEVYKWELLREYKGRPNLDAEDFLAEVKSIKYGNLMYAMSMAVLHQLAREKPTELRVLFRNLFDESKPLTSRIKEFNSDSLLIYRSLGETLSHHQDERTIATYLTFNNPEKYTFYKSSFYKKLCALLNEEPAAKNEKYPHYLALLNRIISEYIEKDPELINLVKGYIPEYYDGSNNLLLAQDILYQMLDRARMSDELNVKQEYIQYVVDNISGGNYFANQFGSKVSRLTAELDEYEQKYKSIFNSDLFIINMKNWKEKVDSITTNLYMKGTDFSTYSDNHQSGRPKAMLGKKNYLRFLNDRFGVDSAINYWVFQGDPKIYDVTAALNKKQLLTWKVSSHKDKIKINDKFILWQTGNKAGCYALGTVNSNVQMMMEDDSDSSNYLNHRAKIANLRVKINIDKNLANDPILKSEIKDIDIFKDFKGSNQGTNFTATKEQYDYLNSATQNLSPMVSIPLNQILYGPPGTGKTYHTVLEAAKIVSGRNISDYNEALKIFNDNLGSQIEFITFHQNYSYEDFIQGLRPDVENGSALTFHKKDGVFKRIADRALNNLKASKNPASAKRDFDIVFHELIQPLNDDEVSEIEIKMKKSSFFITEVGEKSIAFRKNIGDSEHTLSIATLSKMYDKGVNDIILGGLQPYYNPILELLLQMGKSEVQSIQKKNYVIIIDEINRANISRVFGELITLIEPDKRFGGKIPMSVTLPSGDLFMVPDNLYIIGTMNTADKSIALLDIALRRRFEFVPMYPQYENLGQTIHYPEVLRAINEKICNLKTRDFQIGHAYFMENSDLEHIMNRKVIPLLLEYFMNDEKTVREICTVASGTVEPESWPMKFIQN